MPGPADRAGLHRLARALSSAADSRLASVQLRDARTRAEFVARIKAFAATVPAGTWITGGDWDHTLLGRRAAAA